MGNGALPHGPSYRAHPRLYLLRRKLSVRFGTQLPTFVEPPECECLTQSRNFLRTVIRPVTRNARRLAFV